LIDGKQKKIKMYNWMAELSGSENLIVRSFKKR